VPADMTISGNPYKGGDLYPVPAPGL